MTKINENKIKTATSLYNDTMERYEKKDLPKFQEDMNNNPMHTILWMRTFVEQTAQYEVAKLLLLLINEEDATEESVRDYVEHRLHSEMMEAVTRKDEFDRLTHSAMVVALDQELRRWKN